jgi:hypothetical protein
MYSIMENQDRNNPYLNSWFDVLMIQRLLIFLKHAKNWIITESNPTIVEGNHGSGITVTLENHNCSQVSRRPR